MIVNSPQYPTFLEHMIKHFIRILVDGEPYFIAEYHIFVSLKIQIYLIYHYFINLSVIFYTLIIINYICKHIY